MSRRHLTLAALCAILMPALAIAARQTPARTPVAAPQAVSGDAARGEYLATHVAMCVQCHSGRDRDGNILESEKFKGASLPVRSPYANKEWAVKTPAIAGLPGFTDAQILQLLTEGHAGERQPPRPPMPPFRMNRQDAEAIVAFLRTR